MKRQPPYQLSIPEPCTENWSTMRPQGCGRYCSACEKTVVDFTKMSDDEIIRQLKRDSTLCGRMLVTQIDRPLVAIKSAYWPEALFKKLVAVLILAQVFGLEAEAQQKKKAKLSVSINRKTQKRNIASIRGNVLDFETQLPLSGISVSVEFDNGESTNTVTDKLGHFLFTITNPEFKTATLRFINNEQVLNKYIPEETITSERLQHLTIYQYTVQQMEAFELRSTIPVHKVIEPIITQTVEVQGMLVNMTENKHATFWQKLTHPLRKRHHL